MCFGVLMGYFLSKAKINYVNKNKKKFMRNIFLSLFVPTLVHTLYDTLLFYSTNVNSGIVLMIFIVFYVNVFVICMITISIVSKMQVNIKNNTSVVDNRVMINQIPNISSQEIKFCPICGKAVSGGNFCGRCGYKVK